MSDSGWSGWVALAGKLIGSPEDWRTEYRWDNTYYPTKRRAIAAGFPMADGTDDFNIGHVVNGVLVWFGWMDKQFTDAEDYVGPAEQWGWKVPARIAIQPAIAGGAS